MAVCHKVYLKPAYINLHLNSSSHQHPSSHCVHCTLICRVRAFHNQINLYDEFLKAIFRQNGYSDSRFAGLSIL